MIIIKSFNDGSNMSNKRKSIYTLYIEYTLSFYRIKLNPKFDEI